MFSFFGDYGLKPKVLHEKNRLAYLSSATYSLPDGRVLNFGKYNVTGRTHVCIFDPKNGETVVEMTLPKDSYKILGVSDSKIILLATSKNHISILDYPSLSLTDLKDIAGTSDWVHLENGKFLSLQYPTRATEETHKNPFRIVIHDLETSNFYQQASNDLPIKEKEAVCWGSRAGVFLGGLKKLGNGMFACMVLGHNTAYGEIFILKKDCAEMQFQVDGTISLTHKNSAYSPGFVCLNNNELLTYDASGIFKIWDSTNPKDPIDSWSIDALGHGSAIPQQILALPDDKHLLFLTATTLLVFNRETHTSKEVNLGYSRPLEIALLQDDNVYIRASSEKKLDKTQRFIIANFKDVLQPPLNTGTLRSTMNLVSDFFYPSKP